MHRSSWDFSWMESAVMARCCPWAIHHLSQHPYLHLRTFIQCPRLIFTSEVRGRLVLRLLCVFHVCWYICASVLITCTIIISHSLHCCHATLLSRLRQFRRLLCVATTGSLAQLWVRDTDKQRQRRRGSARLTESGNVRSKHLLVVPTESLTNRQQLLGELLSGS